MTRDLFQIKRAVEAGAYDHPLCGYALELMLADLCRHSADRLRVQLPVVKPAEGTVAAGSVSKLLSPPGSVADPRANGAFFSPEQETSE